MYLYFISILVLINGETFLEKRKKQEYGESSILDKRDTFSDKRRKDEFEEYWPKSFERRNSRDSGLKYSTSMPPSPV